MVSLTFPTVTEFGYLEICSHMAQQNNNCTLLISSYNMGRSGKESLIEAVKNEIYL
jgi:hypothetical protein